MDVSEATYLCYSLAHLTPINVDITSSRPQKADQNERECFTCLDDEHPDGPPGVEEVHGVLVELVEVERVDALLGAHQDMLVVRLRVDPRRRAVDPQRAAVEHLGKKQS